MFHIIILTFFIVFRAFRAFRAFSKHIYRLIDPINVFWLINTFINQKHIEKSTFFCSQMATKTRIPLK